MNKKETQGSEPRGKAPKRSVKKTSAAAPKTTAAANVKESKAPAKADKAPGWLSRNFTALALGVGLLLIVIIMAIGWYCMVDRINDLSKALEQTEAQVTRLEDRLADMSANQERILNDLGKLNDAMVEQDLLDIEMEDSMIDALSSGSKEGEIQDGDGKGANLYWLPYAIAVIVIVIIIGATLFFRKSKPDA
ncbi:MAG: hypothetical protein V2J62_01200 [candidate division KSB1 bacterium]|jgi:uncharacterized protein HemX|nr:hypothetical protein [candidate division KSB1 bacterium]